MKPTAPATTSGHTQLSQRSGTASSSGQVLKISKDFSRNREKMGAAGTQKTNRADPVSQIGGLNFCYCCRFFMIDIEHCFFPTKDLIHSCLVAKLSKETNAGDLRLLKKKIAVHRRQKHKP